MQFFDNKMTLIFFYLCYVSHLHYFAFCRKRRKEILKRGRGSYVDCSKTFCDFNLPSRCLQFVMQYSSLQKSLPVLIRNHHHSLSFLFKVIRQFIQITPVVAPCTSEYRETCLLSTSMITKVQNSGNFDLAYRYIKSGAET